MATVRTPIVSFHASGKLAKTVVYSAWKGIGVAREYVVPSNPKTPSQTTQRSHFTAAVDAFRNYLTDTRIRAAWNLLASSGIGAMSGFNRAMQSLLSVMPGDPDASYAIGYNLGATEIAFEMRDMDDGGPPSESGDFDIWLGPSPTTLLLADSQPIVTTTVTSSLPGVPGQIIYVELRKSGWSRSGILRITHP